MCDKDFDLTFVIDGSGSINDAAPGNFGRMKTFINKLIDGFNIGFDNTRVGAITYSSPSHVKTVFDLDTYQDKKSIQNAINAIVYRGGGTSTGRALQKASTKLYTQRQDREDKPNVCMVITDGRSDDSFEGPVNDLRAKKTTIIAIGVGKKYDRAELEKMAGQKQNVFTADFNNLDAVIKQIKLSACVGWL